MRGQLLVDVVRVTHSDPLDPLLAFYPPSGGGRGEERGKKLNQTPQKPSFDEESEAVIKKAATLEKIWTAFSGRCTVLKVLSLVPKWAF